MGNPITEVVPSDISYIDPLLFGSRWNSSTLTYSFPTSGEFLGEDEQHWQAAFTPRVQDWVQNVFTMISQVTNLCFVEVEETATSHAVLQLYSGPGGISGEYPNIGGSSHLWLSTATVTVIDSNEPGWQEKHNYYFNSVIHEIGHTLGLKHPFETIGSFPAGTPEQLFPDFSAMGYPIGVDAYPEELQRGDIAALQYLYGANFTTNAGNTTYKVLLDGTMEVVEGGVISTVSPLESGQLCHTIWDGEGFDTYDFSQLSGDMHIDLRPGMGSVVLEDRRIYLTREEPIYDPCDLQYIIGYVGTRASNIYNAYQYNDDPRSLIEEAIGGSGNDTIIGNVIANVLIGGGGNDSIDGGAGDDMLVGGDGSDIYVFGAGYGKDHIVDYGTGATDVDQIQLVGLNVDDVIFRKSGNDLIIRLKSTDEVLTVQNQFSGSDYNDGVELVAFADSTMLTAEDLENAATPIYLPVLTMQTPTQIWHTWDTSVNFNFTLPTNTFSDPDGQALTYTATLASGLALPSWLNFDGTTSTFTGLPPNINIPAFLDITVTATDTDGLSASETFSVYALRGWWSLTSKGNVLDNVLSGTSGNDIIEGMGGTDQIYGGDGNDILHGIGWLEGGAGNDLYVLSQALFRGTIFDNGFTTDFDTVLFRDINPEDITVDIDNNGDFAFVLNASSGILTIVDEAVAASHIEQFIFADGTIWTCDDFLREASSICGTNGADNLYGATGDDILYGALGDDFLSGGDGNDMLYGGDGRDRLNGGAGSDMLYGGDGDDSFYISGSDGLGDMIRGGEGSEGAFGDMLNIDSDVILDGLDATVMELERLNAGDNGITGTDGDNIFDLRGFTYATVAFIDGAAGNDTIYGWAGNDVLRGGDGNDYMIGDAGDDYLYGGAGNDMLDGRDGNDHLYGGDGDDMLYGQGQGDNYLYGEAGNDTIYGSNGGNDYIDGGAGNDQIYGNPGNNIIYGGAGKDALNGGDGNDVFTFRSSSDSPLDARDLITDFQSGNDKLDFSEFYSGSAWLYQGFTFIGGDDFDTENSAGQLRFEYNASSDTGTLYGKADDNDFAVDLAGVHSLINDDFIGLANAVALSNALDAPASIIPGSDDEPAADDGGTALDGATVDAGDITQYLSASPEGNNTAVNLGAGDYASPVTPNDGNASLDMLLANNQIVV